MNKRRSFPKCRRFEHLIGITKFFSSRDWFLNSCEPPPFLPVRQKWWMKPQGFASRGVSRSSLKTKGFLHIFTNSGKPCLWSRFITLSLHCTCEAAHFIRLWSCRLSAGGCVTFTARLCRLISFTWKPIAAEHSSNGIFDFASASQLRSKWIDTRTRKGGKSQTHSDVEFYLMWIRDCLIWKDINFQKS